MIIVLGLGFRGGKVMMNHGRAESGNGRFLTAGSNKFSLRGINTAHLFLENKTQSAKCKWLILILAERVLGERVFLSTGPI